MAPLGVEWGLHYPAANGEYQSPINLNSREAQYDPALLDIRLSPNYVVCRDCEVINDGHTVRILLKSKSGTYTAPTNKQRIELPFSSSVCIFSQFTVRCSVVSGGPLPSDHEYELHEVRFHWGKENQRGSEHTVNFKAFPMELHLIHWNSTLFNSLDDALGKKNGVLIIALFVQIGKEHLGLKAITEVLQDLQYKGKSKIIPCFNPNTLLPDQMTAAASLTGTELHFYSDASNVERGDQLAYGPCSPEDPGSNLCGVCMFSPCLRGFLDPLLRDYWVYKGSLTTPPCNENVTWILYRYPLTISQLQIEEFRRLRSHIKGAELPEGNDGMLGDNFRPTQPLSDRTVRAAFQ
ncbi:carbonic anhydrase-related protein isoform X2 [Syngnathoides biaculeatus]|uniref:carbonic anhydrase-related protein isoform X2 n=1 Tax=Syngnathoides biaculeatus TaxID=300417 RepID=UPI002ADE6905|nr:carbonic anhydrase-related protein isoform X2 [Syngnathoides biaculeatus]